MQKLVTPTTARQATREMHLDVEIASVATANPKHKVAQADAIAHAKRIFPHFDRLETLFGNTGIEWRYTCQPLSWCHELHGWPDRNAEFQRHALDLLAPLATEAVARADLDLSEIDMLVVNTITGLAVPSLDALLISRIALPERIERLPIFGYGCGGGVAGLARTAQLAASQPGTNALFLTVELCSLCARPNNPSLTAYVSGALFGDGAGAVVLKSPQRNTGIPASRPAIRAVGEHCWRKTEHLLGYTIRDDGFGMVLSPELPTVMRERLGPAMDDFLARHGMTRDEMAGFLFHPGGRKILESAAEIPGPGQTAGLEHSWAVLRDFGNMSSASILFVLERAIRSGARGRHLLSAFGPGFSTYFVVADL